MSVKSTAKREDSDVCTCGNRWDEHSNSGPCAKCAMCFDFEFDAVATAKASKPRRIRNYAERPHQR